MSAFSLHKAALEGQPGLAKSLLTEDPKLINAKDEDGRTPLHWACTTGNLGMIQLLMSFHPDIEARDAMGWTSLMIAAASGRLEATHELLNAGADANAANEKGQTPLHYAASKGYTPIGKALIAKGADVSSLPSNIHTSPSTGTISDQGADKQINAKDRASQFPLHRAATTGSTAFVNILLNPPEGRPKTRLNGADRAGEIFLSTIKRGVAADVQGNTPMHLAMESGHGAVAVMLIEAGADRERPNLESQTPEEIDGVGGEEQKKVRAFVVSAVGPRE